MKLPTLLARKLLRNHIAARMDKPVDVGDAIASFQRMAVVDMPIEDCIMALNVWLKPEHKIALEKMAEGSPERAALLAVYSMSKKDVLGCAIDAVMAVIDSPTGALKDKLAAAAIINELYGEKELIKDEVLTDRLMVNLVGKDK